MNCKEALKDYNRLKSIKAGLEDKSRALEGILSTTEPGLFDRILSELNNTIESIRVRDKEIAELERHFKFLKSEAGLDKNINLCYTLGIKGCRLSREIGESKKRG
jgi:hypothetical protein